MASRYQPPVWSWKADLLKTPTKGMRLEATEISQIYYVNDTFCEIKRENLLLRYLYIKLSFITAPAIFYLLYDLFFANLIELFFGKVLLIVCVYITYNYGYAALFSPYNNPVRFNRKTGMIYINESIFFTFAPIRNLFYVFLPLKKRIKEYHWQDIHCVINSPKADFNNLICVICKPNTCRVIDSFKLGEDIKDDTLIWQWLCNYMSNETPMTNSSPYKPRTFKIWNIIPFIVP